MRKNSKNIKNNVTMLDMSLLKIKKLKSVSKIKKEQRNKKPTLGSVKLQEVKEPRLFSKFGDIKKEERMVERSTSDSVKENYVVELEGVKVDIRIRRIKEGGLIYEVIIPEISLATNALLEVIKRELITEVGVSTAEILDPKVIDRLKTRFREKSSELLTKKIPSLDKITKEFLIGRLLYEMLGLGKIEFLLADINLEEIVINSSEEPVSIYHKRYGWLKTNVEILSELQIQNYANIIARRVGRQITILNPLLDAHLITGDRANAVLYPVSTKGNTLTIRKFARDPWTVTDLIKNKTCSSEVFALLWFAIQYEMNILISGGTASGKTSFLNVCTPFFPPNHRIISIEQTRELQLPKFLYWCPMTVRQPNPEGKGEVSMLDLVVNSLRMRPDRIILGEIRRKEEAEVLFEAMHTGHSVYATVHADSVGETITRLINPPIGIPANLLSAVNLNVVMFRDRRKGIRRVYQIGEYLSVEEEGRISIRPNLLYRWKPADDTIVQHTESVRLFEELSRHTGLNQVEINSDLAIRKKILDWMVRKEIRSIDQVGKIMNEYYLDLKNLLKIIR